MHGPDRMALRDDVIGGVPVRRNATHIVAVDGDDIIHLPSSEPATRVEMEPFITAQRQLEVPDVNTLAVGSCLFTGAPRGPVGPPTFLTDCATSHHGEVFHRLVLDTPGDATSPGDSEVPELGQPAMPRRLRRLYLDRLRLVPPHLLLRLPQPGQLGSR